MKNFINTTTKNLIILVVVLWVCSAGFALSGGLELLNLNGWQVGGILIHMLITPFLFLVPLTGIYDATKKEGF